MRFELDSFHRDIADEQLLDELRRVATLLNQRSVTKEQFDEFAAFHSATVYRRFGSWAMALQAAGLEKSWNHDITNEQLFENLVTLWLKLGRQPRRDDVSNENSLFCSATYYRRFGTWRKALEAFVAWANEGITSVAGKKNTTPITRQRTPRNVNWRLRALVLMRDGARCRLCGADSQKSVLHVDHVVPWSRGGETLLENLQILCEMCNIGKSDYQPSEVVVGEVA